MRPGWYGEGQSFVAVDWPRRPERCHWWCARASARSSACSRDRDGKRCEQQPVERPPDGRAESPPSAGATAPAAADAAPGTARSPARPLRREPGNHRLDDPASTQSDSPGKPDSRQPSLIVVATLAHESNSRSAVPALAVTRQGDPADTRAARTCVGGRRDTTRAPLPTQSKRLPRPLVATAPHDQGSRDGDQRAHDCTSPSLCRQSSGATIIRKSSFPVTKRQSRPRLPLRTNGGSPTVGVGGAVAWPDDCENGRQSVRRGRRRFRILIGEHQRR